jgi:hypothetical protein
VDTLEGLKCGFWLEIAMLCTLPTSFPQKKAFHRSVFDLFLTVS